jgi:hypothetical protein
MSQIYQVIAASAKTTQLFNDLSTDLLKRYGQALKDFCRSAEKEVQQMRLQSTVTAVTGVLTGVVGTGLAFMPAIANLHQINNVATDGMAAAIKNFLSQNHETIKGGLKAAHKALPLIGNAGQTVVQSAVTQAQTAKMLAERTQLNGADQMLRELQDSILRIQEAVRRAQEACART